MSMACPKVTSTCRANTTLTRSPRPMAAKASVTMDRQAESDERGTIREGTVPGGPSPLSSAVAWASVSQDRSPAGEWGRSDWEAATTITHSVLPSLP